MQHPKANVVKNCLTTTSNSANEGKHTKVRKRGKLNTWNELTSRRVKSGDFFWKPLLNYIFYQKLIKYSFIYGKFGTKALKPRCDYYQMMRHVLVITYHMQTAEPIKNPIKECFVLVLLINPNFSQFYHPLYLRENSEGGCSLIHQTIKALMYLETRPKQ